jgi:hypothetical protein
MRLRKIVLAMVLGGSIGLLPWATAAQDDKKDEKSPPAKPAPTIPAKMPDFSKEYANAGEISGVVVTADEESVVIQLKYRVPSGGRYTKEETKNLTFKFAEGALARTKLPPLRANAKGKFEKVPSQELEPRKKPSGAPGLHIERSELKAGDLVTLSLLRPKSIPEAKVAMEDKVVKMAVVTGESTPPKLSREQNEAIANKKKAEEKKK